jgi:2-dehydro-3-deoxyphosphogluconate aldolase/(4S)-4-hydroxy-2-oxoglutarate aldolase
MSDLLQFLKDVPVVGILRDIPGGEEAACIKASAEAGLKAIEVTMNTSGAPAIIRALKKAAAPYGMRVGAGTVRTLQNLKDAQEAGAQFIIAPATIPAVVKECVKADIPVIPGALSPTEVETAYELGAACVKVFPVGAVGGPAYIRDLRGPFRDIPLLACGGVNAANAADYLKAGANLLSFGGSIFKPELMKKGDWETIGQKLREFLAAAKSAV